MGPIETIEYKGFNILVHQDDFFELNGPRDWDNLGHMVCIHRNYDLGDKHEMDHDEIIALTERGDVEYLWLFLLDHSGLWMSTSKFACDPGGWDTSRVGIIYVTHEDIKKEYGRVTKTTIKKAYKLMKGEVETYNQYLTGEVYGFTIEPLADTEIECNDSCWGYYGYDYAMKEMVAEAKSSIDYAIEQHQKMEAEITQLMTECWAY